MPLVDKGLSKSLSAKSSQLDFACLKKNIFHVIKLELSSFFSLLRKEKSSTVIVCLGVSI